jgi:hypothetical protein
MQSTSWNPGGLESRLSTESAPFLGCDRSVPCFKPLCLLCKGVHNSCGATLHPKAGLMIKWVMVVVVDMDLRGRRLP